MQCRQAAYIERVYRAGRMCRHIVYMVRGEKVI